MYFLNELTLYYPGNGKRWQQLAVFLLSIALRSIPHIPNGWFDAYEVKVNKDIFQYQEKVKLISQFQRFILFFNGFLHSHKIIVKII